MLNYQRVTVVDSTACTNHVSCMMQSSRIGVTLGTWMSSVLPKSYKRFPEPGQSSPFAKATAMTNLRQLGWEKKRGNVETGEFQNLQVPRLSCWPIHHTPACWLVLVRINGSIPVCQYVARMMHSSSCFRTEMRLSCMELHHRAARHGFPKVLARNSPMACWKIPQLYFLVGGWPTPLKNMSSSVGIIIPNIWKYGKIKNVLNHQPALMMFSAN